MAVVSLVPIVLVGDLIYKVIATRIGFEIGLVHRLSIGLAMGIGAATLALFYVSLISTRSAFSLTIGLFVLASLLYLGFLLLTGFSRKSKKPDLVRVSLLCVLGLTLVGILWYVSWQAGLGFDGYHHWGIKAKGSFLDGGWILTRAGLSRFAHPAYPLLVPSIQAWIYTFIGEVDEGAVKIIFVIFYLALGGLFFHAVRQLFTRLLAAFFTVLMLSTPLLAITALSAYADVSMTFFLFGSVLFLTKWLDERRMADLVIGSLLSGLLLLVKREAAVYWVVIFLFILGYFLLTRKSAQKRMTIFQMLFFPATAIFIAGSWFLFLQITGIDSGSFETPTLALLFERSERIVVMVQKLVRELFFNFGAWGILWYLFVFTSIWQWRRFTRPSSFLLWISVVLPILLLSISFVFSVWDDYTLHVDTALSRLVLHTVPLAWLFIAKQSSELQAWYQELRYRIGAETIGTNR